MNQSNLPLTFEKLFSLEHLFASWTQFKRGKQKKLDIQTFERYREDRVFDLRDAFVQGHYAHGSYTPFWVKDPKLRKIHKAHINDRFVHYLLYKHLSCQVDRYLAFHSYACRKQKGLHKGIRALQRALYKVTKNNTRCAYALKMDIQKCFHSIDHAILKPKLARYIKGSKIALSSHRQFL